MGWQHGKSVGGLFEKVSNSLLMTDIAYQPSKKSRQHYSKMACCTDQSSNVVFSSLLRYVIMKLQTLETARVRSTVLDFHSAHDVSSAKKILLEAVSYVQLDKPLSRYPERQSTDRMVREMDDVMDILVQIDERKLLSASPSFVTDNSLNWLRTSCASDV